MEWYRNPTIRMYTGCSPDTSRNGKHASLGRHGRSSGHRCRTSNSVTLFSISSPYGERLEARQIGETRSPTAATTEATPNLSSSTTIPCRRTVDNWMLFESAAPKPRGRLHCVASDARPPVVRSRPCQIQRFDADGSARCPSIAARLAAWVVFGPRPISLMYPWSMLGRPMLLGQVARLQKTLLQ
jgi:hypothetical protein